MLEQKPGPTEVLGKICDHFLGKKVKKENQGKERWNKPTNLKATLVPSTPRSMVLIVSTRYEKLVPRHSFPRKKLTLWSSLLRNPVELWIEILLIEIHTALPIMSYPNQIRIHLTVTHTLTESKSLSLSFVVVKNTTNAQILHIVGLRFVCTQVVLNW